MEKRQLLILAVVITAILAIVAAVLLKGKEKTVCPDDICHEGEDCCMDCGCPDGEKCDTMTNSCEPEEIVCGDDICHEEEFCCADCGCPEGQVCNVRANTCEASAICGDGKCEEENCCADCGCQENMICDSSSNRCRPLPAQEIVCGNGKCEFGENEWMCCIDCDCTQEGMICDQSSNICEVAEKIDMDDSTAINVLTDYLLETKTIDTTQNLVFNVSDSLGSSGPCKRVCYRQTDLEVLVGGCACVYENNVVDDEVRYI